MRGRSTAAQKHSHTASPPAPKRVDDTRTTHDATVNNSTRECGEHDRRNRRAVVANTAVVQSKVVDSVSDLGDTTTDRCCVTYKLAVAKHHARPTTDVHHTT